MYPSKLPARKLEKHLGHSGGLADEQLDDILDKIDQRHLDTLVQQINEKRRDSYNLASMKDRDAKMLLNYDKYQKIWRSNLP